jgi:hypothetical protein
VSAIGIKPDAGIFQRLDKAIKCANRRWREVLTRALVFLHREPIHSLAGGKLLQRPAETGARRLQRSPTHANRKHEPENTVGELCHQPIKSSPCVGLALECGLPRGGGHLRPGSARLGRSQKDGLPVSLAGNTSYAAQGRQLAHKGRGQQGRCPFLTGIEQCGVIMDKYRLRMLASLLAFTVAAGIAPQAQALPKQCPIHTSTQTFNFGDGDWAVFGSCRCLVYVCVNGKWVFWFNNDRGGPRTPPPRG